MRITKVLALVGLVAYLALFFAVDLPDLHGALGSPVRRLSFLLFLLQPDQLAQCWFGAPAEFSLLDRLPVLALAGAILGVATALGWLLLRLVRADRSLNRLEIAAFAPAVGLLAISTFVLAMGLAGMLNRAAFVGAGLLVLGAAAWAAIKGRVGRAKRVPPGKKWGVVSGWWLAKETEYSVPSTRYAVSGTRFALPTLQEIPSRGIDARWLWAAAPFVAIIVLGGMLPPIDFDVREYHLQVPKEFFQQGRITFLPHNVYGNMPLGTEMLSLLAMVLSGDWWLGALAGKTVIAMFAPLTALGLLAAGRRLFSPTAGVIAALVYLSIPWIIQVSTCGLVEGASACYLLLAVYAVILWSRGVGGKSLLVLAGYLAGGAVSCKYPAVLFVVLPLTVWVATERLVRRICDPSDPCGRFTKPSYMGWWKSISIFLLAVVAGCGLWFGKNWVLAGNPTYPLLYSWLGGKTWTQHKDQQWNRVHRPHDFSVTALGDSIAQVGASSPWLSPLVIPLAALGLLLGTRGACPTRLALLCVYILAGWWLLTHRIDRFWIPALAPAALLAGAGACWTDDRRWRRVLMGLLAAGLAMNFLVACSLGGGYNRYFVSLQTLRTSPERVDPWHLYLNAHAQGGRVLLVGDAAVFDLTVPILYNTCFDDSILQQLVEHRSPDQIRRELTERGITHVYVSWDEIKRYRDSYGYTDFVQPEVFDRLVETGILRSLPPLKNHLGRGYEVK